MKKVLFVIEDMNNSGSPLTALHFMEALKSECELTVLVLCANGPTDIARLPSFLKITKKIIKANFPHFLSKKFKINYLYYVSKINKEIDNLFEKERYDYVYFNRYYVCGFFAKHIKNNYSSAKIIFNSLGEISIASKFLILKFFIKTSIKLLCIYSDKIVAISLKCFPRCRDEYKKKFLVIHDYPGIDKKTNLKHFSKKGQIVLGQIGYFCNLKNQLFSLKVLARLLDMGVEARIIFIGFLIDEKYWNKINAFIVENKLVNNVSFYQSSYDKDLFFDEIDIAIMPSLSEGFPLTILESFYRKTPVLSSLAIPEESDFGHLKKLELNEELWVDYLLSETYKRDVLNNCNLYADFNNCILKCFDS